MITTNVCPCDTKPEIKTKEVIETKDLTVLLARMKKVCFTYKELELWRKAQQG